MLSADDDVAKQLVGEVRLEIMKIAG
jgi:hypothetical protein